MFKQLWGKFGQRSNLSRYEFCKDYHKLIAKLNDPCTKRSKLHIINENCVELRSEALIDFNIEASYTSEITAVFATSNARLRLSALMEWLDPSQVSYCDTDSVMFVNDKNNKYHKEPVNDKPDCVPPRGIRFAAKKQGGLGDWENELEADDWIEELVVGGAKSYAYRSH